MDNPTPTVGRIVHYVSHGTPTREDGSQAYTSQCRAAIVTAVPGEASEDGPCISLAVLNPTGMFFQEHVCLDKGVAFEVDDPRPALDGGLAYQGGTWHWPERV